MSKSLPTNTCTEPWFCSPCGFGQTPEEPAQRDRRAQAVPWQGQHTHTHTHFWRLQTHSYYGRNGWWKGGENCFLGIAQTYTKAGK